VTSYGRELGWRLCVQLPHRRITCLRRLHTYDNLQRMEGQQGQCFDLQRVRITDQTFEFKPAGFSRSLALREDRFRVGIGDISTPVNDASQHVRTDERWPCSGGRGWHHRIGRFALLGSGCDCRNSPADHSCCTLLKKASSGDLKISNICLVTIITL